MAKQSKASVERLDKLLSRLGYCSRSEVRSLIRDEVVTSPTRQKLTPDLKVNPGEILFDGEPLDPLELFIVLHKPCGYVCSRAGDEGPSIYDLLPPRFAARNPPLVSIGRLDKDTSGLLLMTDDGDLVHEYTSPRAAKVKRYRVTLASPLRGDEAEIFARGDLVLRDEESLREAKGDEPLLPAVLTVCGSYEAILGITQGRYHQVRRMFRAVGNEVLTLHREAVGEFDLSGVKEGEYKLVSSSLRVVE